MLSQSDDAIPWQNLYLAWWFEKTEYDSKYIAELSDKYSGIKPEITSVGLYNINDSLNPGQSAYCTIQKMQKDFFSSRDVIKYATYSKQYNNFAVYLSSIYNQFWYSCLLTRMRWW